MEKKLISINTDFSIYSFKGGFDNNFSYVLTCMRTGTEIIVDAAIRLETIKPFIKSSPSAILVTHTHKDHIEYINTYIELNCLIKVLQFIRLVNNYTNVFTIFRLIINY